MAAAKASLSGGIRGISIRGRSEGVRRKMVSRKQSGVCVFVECRAGVVEGEALGPKSHAFFLFYSFFFFYYAFIVFRYKKLRAALAMEKTKAINQYKQEKKPFSYSTVTTENT